MSRPANDLDLMVHTTDRDGHRWAVHPTGWTHPVVSGGADGEPDPPAPPAPTPPTPPANPPAPAAVDSVPKTEAERLAREAREQAVQDLLGQFGEGMTAEKAKQIIDAQRAAEDAKKDEATRRLEEAQTKEQRATERETAAARKERRLDVKEALLTGQVKADRVNQAAELIMAQLADGADADAIKAAVETFKTDTPEWFPAPGQPPAPSSLPIGTPPASPPADDLAEARERGKSWRESRQGPSREPFEGFRKLG